MSSRGLWRSSAAAGIAVALLAGGPAVRAAEPETVGVVRTLENPTPHWFWLSDIILHRTALFDADAGSLLGVITAGTPGVGFIVLPQISADKREIYIAESYFSRGVRGERTDVVTVYDGSTLQPLHETGIPPKRAEYFPGNASSTLSDDGQLMAVFNLTPMTSLSIVDVKARRFVAEVPTPGCSLVYAAGPRRFLMLCANGEGLLVTVDAAGKAEATRTARFFDPQQDPITEKAVRRGNDWFFVSFEGMVHPVDVASDTLRFGEPWSLFDDADRQAKWRIGGGQLLAIHGPTGRLYGLMHQGGPDTHKEPGTEVWVYDLAGRKRVQRIPLLSPLMSFVAQQAALDPATTKGRFGRWFLDKVMPHLGVERILVTQDDKPILIASASMPPTVTIHDAMSGAVLREVSEPGLGGGLLVPH